jgi:hypothetical protein
MGVLDERSPFSGWRNFVQARYKSFAPIASIIYACFEDEEFLEKLNCCWFSASVIKNQDYEIGLKVSPSLMGGFHARWIRRNERYQE